MASKSKKPSAAGGLKLKEAPNASVMSKSRKAKGIGKHPKKPSKPKGGIKTLTQAESYATKWNDWVEKIRERASTYDEQQRDKDRLKAAKAAISGLR